MAGVRRLRTLRRSPVEKVVARAARIDQAKAPGGVASVLLPLLMLKTAMNREKTIGPEQRHQVDS
jgi:hypothetical protein